MVVGGRELGGTRSGGGCAIKPLFLERSFTGYRALGLVLLSVVLMVVDHRTDWTAPLRSVLITVTTPLHRIADVPQALVDEISALVFLHRDNADLRRKVMHLSVRLQRLEALEEENARLRSLLGSSRRVENRVRFAEVVGISPDPQRAMLTLDKGLGDGVRVGQAVLDSQGLVGQIVEAGLASSRVLMITDLSHSTPVQVLRNDYRAILRGTGEVDRLLLQHVPDTADIREGDLLITSGLGGRFPSGYPVALVRQVVHDPAEPFALVVTESTAELARSRHLVVVTDAGQVPAPPDPSGPAAAEGETAP